MRTGLAVAAAAALLLPAGRADAGEKTVSSIDELRRTAEGAKPGDRIRIAPGEYAGGLHLAGLRGAEGKPVVLEALDRKRPPTFRGGGSAIQLTDPVHVEVRDLVVEGATGNGVNVDDGGTPDTPASDVVLADLVVRDVGPRGNCDGIKLSGLLRFRVERCVVERWGTGGSAVDMVGCRDGTIEGCTFRHDEAAAAGGASGVQAKGGSRDVAIRGNRFEHAGSRAINAGGSTGLQYFRPPLETWTEPRYEAKAIRVEGNVIVGSDAAVAFVGVDAPVFRFNTIVRPRRWAMRILQETREPGFVPCRAGVVSDNLFVFREGAWSEGGCNVGPGTEPASFRFERNAWFCEDAPARTRALVRLPAEERDGTYGVDPRFSAGDDFRPRAGGGLDKVGAHAWRDAEKAK